MAVIKAFAIAPETRDQLIDLLEAVARGDQPRGTAAWAQAMAAANILPHIKGAPAASAASPMTRTIYEPALGPDMGS
jgi:hypothetical protein